MLRSTSRQPIASSPLVIAPLAAAIAAAVAIAIAIAGCAERAGVGEETRDLDRVVIALSGDIAGINPLTSDDERTREVLDQLFLRLFEEQPDYAEHPPSLELELAAATEWSADGLELTLDLRPEARWSDGEPITAEDVAWTLAARVDPDVAWPYADTQERIAGWEVRGEHRIAIRFHTLYPDRLTDLNASPILPRHAWGGLPFDQWRQGEEWFRRNLVVSGPFQLAGWKPNEQLDLVRNPGYFRPDRPRLSRVVLMVVPEAANRLEKLLAGEVDFVSALRPSTAERVASSPTARLQTFWHNQYAYIMWNGCRPPLDDPVVRRALTMGIDRAAVLEAVYGEHARLAVSPILSSIWAFDRELEPWPYDPREAARLLDSRGWSDGDGDGVRERDGVPLKLRLATNSGNRMRVDTINLVRGYLTDLGVDVELEPLEFGTWLARSKERDYDASVGTWLTDTTLDLHYLFHGDAIDGGGNWVCYRNPEVDRLIELARAQTAAEGKLDPLLGIQRIIHGDQPYTFLFELKRLNGMSRRLRDAEPTPLDTFADLEDWWIDPAL